MKHQNHLKAVTTGFAGAVALAAGTEAYAAPVAAVPPMSYVPTSTTSDYEPSWDVNNDGTADFQFVFYQIPGSTGLNFLSGIYGYGGVGIAAPVAYVGAFATYVNRLSAGATIGPASGFAQTSPYFDVFASRYKTKLYGQFKTTTTGFVGFEFTATDGLHYGYIQITTSRYVSATNPGGLIFGPAFYESTPNTPITIVPEPGTLVSLAFGAAALGGVALRRRKA